MTHPAKPDSFISSFRQIVTEEGKKIQMEKPATFENKMGDREIKSEFFHRTGCCGWAWQNADLVFLTEMAFSVGLYFVK